MRRTTGTALEESLVIPAAAVTAAPATAGGVSHASAAVGARGASTAPVGRVDVPAAAMIPIRSAAPAIDPVTFAKPRAAVAIGNATAASAGPDAPCPCERKADNEEGAENEFAL